MSIKKILPSKKFMKVLGGIILIILIIVLVGIAKNRKTIYKQNTDGKVIVVSDVTEKDTDGDGLKDWEESLWGTDINKADSDGDGISDGDEISKIQEFLKEKNSDPDNLNNDTTKTGALTRDVLTISQVISASGEITPESREAITNEIAKYIGEKTTGTVYQIPNLTIIEKPTKKEISAYLTLINQSLKRTYTTQEDVDLILEYDKNMDAGEVTAYINTANKFKKEEEFLKKIAVPNQYSTLHLDYLNSIAGVASLYTDLSLYDTDPVVSVGAFNSIQPILFKYQESQKAIDIEVRKIYTI